MPRQPSQQKKTGKDGKSFENVSESSKLLTCLAKCDPILKKKNVQTNKADRQAVPTTTAVEVEVVHTSVAVI